MTQLPNIITLLRIAGSIGLLPFEIIQYDLRCLRPPVIWRETVEESFLKKEIQCNFAILRVSESDAKLYLSMAEHKPNVGNIDKVNFAIQRGGTRGEQEFGITGKQKHPHAVEA